MQVEVFKRRGKKLELLFFSLTHSLFLALFHVSGRASRTLRNPFVEHALLRRSTPCARAPAFQGRRSLRRRRIEPSPQMASSRSHLPPPPPLPPRAAPPPAAATPRRSAPCRRQVQTDRQKPSRHSRRPHRVSRGRWEPPHFDCHHCRRRRRRRGSSEPSPRRRRWRRQRQSPRPRPLRLLLDLAPGAAPSPSAARRPSPGGPRPPAPPRRTRPRRREWPEAGSDASRKLPSTRC